MSENKTKKRISGSKLTPKKTDKKAHIRASLSSKDLKECSLERRRFRKIISEIACESGGKKESYKEVSEIVCEAAGPSGDKKSSSE